MMGKVRLASITLSLLALTAGAAAFAQVRAEFNLPPQSLAESLRVLGSLTSTNVLVEPELVDGRQAPALSAQLTVGEALSRLLAGTGLGYRFLNETTVVLEVREEGEVRTSGGARQMKREGLALAQVDAKEGSQESKEEEQGSVNDSLGATVGKEEDSERGGIPEILVTGSKIKSLNADIRRTEDNIQPYVIFDRNKLASSGAANMEEFFKQELTVSTNTLMAGQAPVVGNRSQINLRGLGAEETLILIDGRRMAGFNFDGSPKQPDINGIPLPAVERIEILPTTASGIYGGGATGGVINIVLRRDYSGFETQLTYGNSFESDVTTRRVDMNAGLNFNGGKTNLLFAASYSDANELLVGERDLLQRGRQHVLNTNPGFFLNARTPPLGSTPNIRSSNGSNLILDDDTPLNSPVTFIPAGYPGPATDGGAALVSNSGSYNLELPDTAQQNGLQSGLLSAPEVSSLMMTLRHELTSYAQVFIELQGSNSTTNRSANSVNPVAIIPGNAPNNPFQQTIRVTVPAVGLDETVQSESEDRRAVTGVVARLPGEWQGGLDFTWNRSRSSYTRPPQGLSSATQSDIDSGLLDVLRDVNQYHVPLEPGIRSTQSPGDMVLRSTSIRLAGPVALPLPGGFPTLSTLIEHRDESVGDTTAICCNGLRFLVPARSQTVDSVYIELKVPIAAASNRKPGLELLELQVAGRHDQYQVKGATAFVDLDAPVPVERTTNKNSSTDPTMGLRYKPLSSLMIRGSYGTGYLPPSMMNLVPEPPSPSDLAFAGLMDPLRGGESVGFVDWVQGGNPDLKPEESESWSAGLVVTPRMVSGLRIAADWTQIEKKNNIVPPDVTSSQQVFEQFLTLFPERASRGEPSGGFSVGPIVGINATQINLAHMRVEAVDVALDYQVEGGRAGSFDLSLNATRLLSLETQLAPSEPVIQEAGVLQPFDIGGGLKWKASASLGWAYRGWDLGWRTRLFDSYFFDSLHSVNPNQGAASVSSQTYHDISGSYRFSTESSGSLAILADTEVRFGVNNVFNKKPPLDLAYGLAAMYSSLGDPRLANYYLSIRKSLGD